MGGLFHTGDYPLLPVVAKKLQHDIISKINIANGTVFPPDAVGIINVIELPKEVAEEINKTKIVS